ncbi:MAG: type III toxin-antitoxin system ToxN/AbiQ family toxin [Anaeroplasma bactoclasticum]|nr:type III toxin-antitoxin system ToxN/AbiQ family toxin [Anaeroplasma bactoclasticum]MCM1556042.1 type III toxin-antitoxin system ToxN/AbiQ family toxin [Anaeroplasma bactoclasticum]
MDLYNISDEYIDYLSSVDRNVLKAHVDDRTFKRPHIGIVIHNSNMDYFIPLSSPEQSDYSHGVLRPSNITIKRLIGDNNEFLGKLRINNMIPAPLSELKLVDMDLSNKSSNDIFYINLLNKQIRVIASRQAEIDKSANLVYNHKLNENNPNYWADKPIHGFLSATVNFKLVEQQCLEWISSKLKKLSTNHVNFFLTLY